MFCACTSRTEADSHLKAHNSSPRRRGRRSRFPQYLHFPPTSSATLRSCPRPPPSPRRRRRTFSRSSRPTRTARSFYPYTASCGPHGPQGSQFSRLTRPPSRHHHAFPASRHRRRRTCPSSSSRCPRPWRSRSSKAGCTSPRHLYCYNLSFRNSHHRPRPASRRS